MFSEKLFPRLNTLLKAILSFQATLEDLKLEKQLVTLFLTYVRILTKQSSAYVFSREILESKYLQQMNSSIILLSQKA